MANRKEIVIRRSTRWVGVAAAARRIGCAPAHLSQILRGVRKSNRTMELLSKNRVRIEAGEVK